MNRYYELESYFDKYKQEQRAPSAVSDAGNENIMTAEGALAYSATDLTLPGKGGFDLVLQRRYNSNDDDDRFGEQMVYSVLGGARLDTVNSSDKYVYRYYINGDSSSEPVYIAFGSENELLQKERNGIIYTAADYTKNKVGNWGSPGGGIGSGSAQEKYTYYAYDLKSPKEIGFSFGKPFYHARALPRGNDVVLVRDKTTRPDIIELHAIHSNIYSSSYSFDSMAIGDGWSLAHPAAQVLSQEQTRSSSATTEYGKFTDPETGMMLFYRARYIEESDDSYFRPLSARVISYDRKEEVQSGMYRIEVLRSLYDPVYYEDETMDTPRMIITRYDGVKFYFRPAKNGDMMLSLMKKEDRFGNVITYYGDDGCDTIVDTYGRTVTLRHDKGIRISGIDVNGTATVRYEMTESNDDGLDPNNILKEDNIHTLKVYTALPGFAERAVTYYSRNFTDLWYMGDELPQGAVITVPCKKSQLYRIELPNGAQIKYEYETKMNKTGIRSTKRDYDVVTTRAEFLPGSQIGINRRAYSYDFDTRESTMRVYGKNYTHTEWFDSEKNVIKETLTTEKGSSTIEYTQTRQAEGNYLPTQIVITNRCGFNSFIKTITRAYDSHQKLIKEEDGLNTREYQYSTYGLLVKTKQLREEGVYIGEEYNIKNGAYSEKWSYYQDGEKASIRTGFKEKYTHNANGELTETSMTDGSNGNRLTTYSYTYPALTATRTDGISLIKTTTEKQVEAITGASGESPEARDIVRTETYDFWGNLIQVTENGERTTLYEYDDLHRLTKQTNPDGTYISMAYDDMNNIITVTDVRGVKQKIEYDALGRQTKLYLENESGGFDLVRQNTYNEQSEVVRVRLYSSPGTEKSRAEYTYFGDGEVKSEKVYEGSKLLSQKQFGGKTAAAGEVQESSVTIKTGLAHDTVVTRGIDKWGRVVSEKINGIKNDLQKSLSASYDYDLAGGLIKQTDFGGKEVSYTYNLLFNRVASRTDSLGTTSYQYDYFGNVSSVTDPASDLTSYTYNARGQEIFSKRSIYFNTNQYYDAYGNLTQKKLRQWWGSKDYPEVYQTTRYLYDSMNRMTAEISNDGSAEHAVRYEYDAGGNLLRRITGLESATEAYDAQKHAQTSFAYDKQGRMIRQTDAQGQSETMEYDNLGNLLRKTDRSGKVTEYTYDGMGRMTSRSCSGLTERWEYNLLGLVSKMTDLSGTTQYEYDGFGELTKEIKGSIIKTYTYDESGNRASFLLKNGTATMLNAEYSFINANALHTLNANGAKTTYFYNSGRLSKDRTDSLPFKEYDYDGTGRQSGVRLRGKGEELNYGLSRDRAGNVSQQNADGLVSNYSYDGMGRITAEWIGEQYTDLYSYDRFGNISVKTHSDLTDAEKSYTLHFSYDKNNRLTRRTKESDGFQEIFDYCYDANGNCEARLRSEIRASAGEEDKTEELVLTQDNADAVFYRYDAFNRLVSVEDGENTASYTYDGNNLRQSKTVNGVTTTHIYDGAEVTADITGDRQSVYVRDLNGILFREENGEKMHYISNPRGDVSAYYYSRTRLLPTYTYDAFGNQTEASGTDPFRYSGEYYDAESGFIYLRNRYYDPSIGRFITEDPAQSGTNWYVYANNNPLIYIDPWGLFDYNTMYRQGDPYNIEIEVLQNELKYLGYYSGKIDGLFGQNTDVAVRKLQGDRGLDVDGVVGVNTWKSLGLKYRTYKDIAAGVEIVTIGRRQYFDISKVFNNCLWDAEQNLQGLGIAERYGAWYNKVNHGGDWDIKLKEPWTTTLGVSYPGAINAQVVLYGKISTPEEMGNIFYGYTGSSIGLPTGTLLAGSLYAAGTGGTLKSYEGLNAEFSDWRSIRDGIQWYYNKHPMEARP